MYHPRSTCLVGGGHSLLVAHLHVGGHHFSPTVVPPRRIPIDLHSISCWWNTNRTYGLPYFSIIWLRLKIWSWQDLFAIAGEMKLNQLKIALDSENDFSCPQFHQIVENKIFENNHKEYRCVLSPSQESSFYKCDPINMFWQIIKPYYSEF